MNYQREMLDLNHQRKEEIRKMQASVASKKASEAKSIKKQSFENELRKQELLRDHMTKNQEKKTLVKMQEGAAAQKINTIKQKKMQEFKMGYEQRVKEELDRIKQKQLELSNMEKTEGELIKKLQNTQKMQKDAFGELETAIKQPSPAKDGSRSPKSFASASKDAKPAPAPVPAPAPATVPAPAPAPAPVPAAPSGKVN